MDRNHRQQGASDRADIYSRITKEIVDTIEAIQAGACADWKLPWHHDGSNVARPMNIASKNKYRGINILALWIASMKAGFGSGLWGTYRQFAEVGAQVRRGERATTVVFWKEFRRGESDDGGGVSDGIIRNFVSGACLGSPDDEPFFEQDSELRLRFRPFPR